MAAAPGGEHAHMMLIHARSHRASASSIHRDVQVQRGSFKMVADVCALHELQKVRRLVPREDQEVVVGAHVQLTVGRTEVDDLKAHRGWSGLQPHGEGDVYFMEALSSGAPDVDLVVVPAGSLWYQQSRGDTGEAARRVEGGMRAEGEAMMVARLAFIEDENAVLAPRLALFVLVVVVLPRARTDVPLDREDEDEALANDNLQRLAVIGQVGLRAPLLVGVAALVLAALVLAVLVIAVSPLEDRRRDRRTRLGLRREQTRNDTRANNPRRVWPVVSLGFVVDVVMLRGEVELAVAARQEAGGRKADRRQPTRSQRQASHCAA